MNSFQVLFHMCKTAVIPILDKCHYHLFDLYYAVVSCIDVFTKPTYLFLFLVAA